MGWGPGRGQGQGLKKKSPRPGPLTGAGRGIEAGARRFRGPGGPVTNTIYIIVTGLFLSNENTIGLAIDLLALVLRESSGDQK